MVILLAGCTPAGDEQRAVFAVFGTEVELKLREASDIQAEEVFRQVGTLLQRLHRELHPWEDGELMALNRALAAGLEHRTTPEIAELIEVSAGLEQSTAGTFNPAIGALVNLWGFHTSTYPITEPPPAPSLVEALVAESPSMLDLSLQGTTVRTHNRAVRLDFSGIAKGLAVKRVCAIV
ncbi:MAG: FAD:protein FMN transferase, partial [Wenzhouxiangellaceae bacterium]